MAEIRGLRDEFRFRAISIAGWLLMQFLGRSTRFRLAGFENVEACERSKQGAILAIWHGRTMLPIFYCRGRGFWALNSLSRDGELQTRIMSKFGYQVIRGSTGRGGAKAALTASRRLKDGGILAITPDGPMGPPCVVQEGTTFLARHANCVVIPVGVGLSRRKLLHAWDSYAVPLPFGRCALVFGEPISIGSEEADESPEERIGRAICDVQRRAQEMVGEG